jgi:dTDP-4-dehydrorhamnose 3,5-epimerase-like enzyme
VGKHAPKVRVSDLPNNGDGRGYSFTAPAEALDFVGRVRDVHLSSMLPGSVRGNHSHLRRREAIVVLHEDHWSLHWHEDEHGAPSHRQFGGVGAKLILVMPGASHAIRNNGGKPLSLVAFASEPYDPAETVARKLI